MEISKLEKPEERLKYYIEVACLESTNSFVKIVGISESILRHYFKGRAIGNEALKKIKIRISDAPLDWIIDGIGEIPKRGSAVNSINSKLECPNCKTTLFMLKEVMDTIIKLKKENLGKS